MDTFTEGEERALGGVVRTRTLSGAVRCGAHGLKLNCGLEGEVVVVTEIARPGR